MAFSSVTVARFTVTAELHRVASVRSVASISFGGCLAGSEFSPLNPRGCDLSQSFEACPICIDFQQETVAPLRYNDSMNENETSINVNDLHPGMKVWGFSMWWDFDHICYGPRGDSRWLCIKRKDGTISHRTTHRWSRESVRVLLPTSNPEN